MRDDLAQVVGLLGALVLVGSALLARKSFFSRDHRLWRWAALWIGIFIIAAVIASSFT